MASYRVVQWRDIPALVEAADADGTARRPLSARFQELIDAVAMRAGATDGDAYLDGWTHGPGSERPGTAAAVADAVAAELESGFEALAARHLRPTP